MLVFTPEHLKGELFINNLDRRKKPNFFEILPFLRSWNLAWLNKESNIRKIWFEKKHFFDH